MTQIRQKKSFDRINRMNKKIDFDPVIPVKTLLSSVRICVICVYLRLFCLPLER
jgi:hypothetical protein